MTKKIIVLFALLICNGCTTLQANDLSPLFDRVDPSVVVITILEQTLSEKRFGETVTHSNLGSGVIISKDGLVLTASHVVHMAAALSVTLIDDTSLSAEVVGSIPGADVALVKIKHPPTGLSAAKLGDSDRVRTGEPVFVIGAPRGLEHTLTVGHISGRRSVDKLLGDLVPIEYLQTDAAINAGNSGGPMFNMKGEVVGIVSSILTESGGFEGIGFAAAINVARELLLKKPTVWYGLDSFLLSGPLAKAFNVPQEAGLLIQRVATEAVGKKLGLRPGNIWIELGEQKIIIGGDIILSIEDIPITTDHDEWARIRQIITAKGNHDALSVKVLRDGEIVHINMPTNASTMER